jgi:Porin subfamily
MKNGRNLAIAAAIACALSAPLVIGSSAVQADELGDLRTNQALLENRLDQLAQVGLQRPQEPPGTPTLAGSFPRSFLIPGTETSIRVGGEINMTGVYWFSGGNNANVGEGTQISGVPGASTAPLNFKVPGVLNPVKARANSVFDYSIYASRLRFETRTPTGYGESQTVFEFDFLGCSIGGFDCNNTVSNNNGLGARLRLAYGTLGNFAAGQMYSAATQDLAAAPESIDTGCCAGDFGTGRLPAVNYRVPVVPFFGLPPATLIFGLVDPEDSTVTPNGGTLTNNTNLVTAVGTTTTINNNGVVLNAGSNQPLSVNPTKTQWPDIQFGVRTEQQWGHLQLSSVVHEAALKDGAFVDRTYIGYGGAFSGDVKPRWFNWQKDDFGFTAFAGDGLGRYAGGGGAGNYFPYLATNYGAPTGALGNSSGNSCGYGHAGVTPTAACAGNIRAATIPAWGGQFWYQHWWAPTIRSTALFGVTHEDVPTSIIGSQAATGGPAATGGAAAINKEIVDAQVNLLWSPVPFIDTGIEYLWTHRQTIYNLKGDQNIAMAMFKVKF